MTSPPERLHSWIFGLLDAIENGALENTLKAWLQHGLSTTMGITGEMGKDDVHFSGVQLREDVKVMGELLKRTTLGIIRGVTTYKARPEKCMKPLSFAEVARRYKRVTLSETSEVISDGWVDMAITINNRL